MEKDKESYCKSAIRHIPHHVAIITDGNGRWATRKGLPRSFGHKAGVEPIRDITEACAKVGVKTLTWYGFSAENWKRDKDEVDFLMRLFVDFFRQWREEILYQGIRFHHIGSKERLPKDLVYEIERTEEMTCTNDKMEVNIALNYGGREEIVQATRLISNDVSDGKLRLDEINEKVIENYLYTAGQTDPDILIRTSGEIRISNFLIWQITKTQIWTTSVLWPDFTREHLWEALKSYVPYKAS